MGWKGGGFERGRVRNVTAGEKQSADASAEHRARVLQRLLEGARGSAAMLADKGGGAPPNTPHILQTENIAIAITHPVDLLLTHLYLYRKEG